MDPTWPFGDFERLFRVTDSIYFLEKKLIERFERIKDLKLYLDSERKSELKINFGTIKDVLKVNGETKKEEAKKYAIYFDFKSPYHEPLLLNH